MERIFTIEKAMPPVWMMFPYHRYSIGWRMGCGESYKYELFEWKESLSEEEKKQYKEMFPAPKTWKGYYNEEEDEDNDEYFYRTVEFWSNCGEMQYSRSWLMNQISKGYKPKFTLFQQEDNSSNESCLNRWYYTEFELDMDSYWCLGQYTAAEKARFFEDEEREKLIMESKNREEIKALDKQVRNFDAAEWDKVKYSVALNGNYLKFSQNIEIRETLLSTENRVLVEVNESEKETDPNLCQGENLSGFALMEVRDEIRNVYKNYNKIDWSLLEK